MRKLYLLLIAILALTLSTAAFADEHMVTVTLEELNASGISGTAWLTDNGDGTTTVSVELEGSPEGGVHPAHIHEGSCPEVGAVVADIGPIEGGANETTVEMSLEDILGGEHAINVHKSPEEVQVYVACGDITAEVPDTGAGGLARSSTPVAPVAVALAGALLLGGVFLVTRRRNA